MKWLQTTSRQLTAFFVIAFVLTWAAWIPVFSHPDQVPSQISFIGLFAPAISALVVASLANGKAGIGNILKKYFTWHLDVDHRAHLGCIPSHVWVDAEFCDGEGSKQ